MNTQNESPATVTTSAEQPAGHNNNNRQQSRKARPDNRWNEVAELVKSGALTSVLVTDIATNKEGARRGLSIKLKGLRGFLPGSEMPRNANYDELKGKTIEVIVLESDPKARGGRLIVSLKAVADGARKQFIEGLQLEQEVTGPVVSVTEFGYFVNIGGLDALLHISQTPLDNGKPKVFTKGETVTARIKSIDLEKGKVGLTMRKPRSESDGNQRGRNGGNQQYASRNTERFSRKPAVSSPRSYTTAKASDPAPTPGKPRKLKATKKSPFTQQFSSFGDLAAYMNQKESGVASENPATTEVPSAAEQA
jgi:transcriptional accessory protein Tex/SPT6